MAPMHLQMALEVEEAVVAGMLSLPRLLLSLTQAPSTPVAVLVALAVRLLTVGQEETEVMDGITL